METIKLFAYIFTDENRSGDFFPVEECKPYANESDWFSLTHIYSNRILHIYA